MAGIFETAQEWIAAWPAAAGAAAVWCACAADGWPVFRALSKIGPCAGEGCRQRALRMAYLALNAPLCGLCALALPEALGEQSPAAQALWQGGILALGIRLNIALALWDEKI